MIFINFNLSDSAWGGANQFLNALKKEFIYRGFYTKKITKTKWIIANSHHDLGKILIYKALNSNFRILHRVDGPIFLSRGADSYIDLYIYRFNKLLADATIFQSYWSLEHNVSQGMFLKTPYKVIANGVDLEYFYEAKNESAANKIKIISTSWSTNINKGEEDYKWLDANLDFSRIEYTFIGNSSIKFKNIKSISALPSKELAKKLRENHVFISCSKNDPCSNSLIEAEACGLLTIAANSGGHPEIISDRNFLYNQITEVPKMLRQISQANYLSKEAKNRFDIKYLANEYLDFMRNVEETEKNKAPISITKFFLILYNQFTYYFKTILKFMSLFFSKIIT